ncbi:MAG: hypothetical protein RIQ53_78 [Pseudomonadota bacterium]
MPAPHLPPVQTAPPVPSARSAGLQATAAPSQPAGLVHSAATAAPHAAPPVQPIACQDLDEQAARLDGWNLRYCQLSPGRFEDSVATLEAGGVRLVAERLNRTLLQRGAVQPGRLVVGVPVHYDGHAVLCGQRSHRDGLHLFSGADGFDFLSPAEHLVINIELHGAALQRPALRATVERLAARLGPRPAVHDLPPQAMTALRERLLMLMAALHHDSALLARGTARDAVERTVVHALAEAMGEGMAEALQPAGPPETTACRPSAAPRQAQAQVEAEVHAQAQAQARLAETAPRPGASDMHRPWRLVRAVQARIDAHAEDCPLSVAELVADIGVSRRSLQYAFESALGLNPVAYLRAERLNRARAALGRAGSVTEAATRFGFWHFGRFANDYRALFGERPSETFRRRQAQGAGPAIGHGLN